MMIKASDYIARYLYSRGVRTVYELPGGMITHMLNSLYEFQKIRVVSVHHEQAAAFAADATGRITGVPGVAMATSMVSVLTGIPIRRDVAMTGEITLRGRVLPIGGLKEKLLAALRAGITTVFFPKDNEKDLAEIPDNVRRALKLIPVSHVDDVIGQALVRRPEAIEWEEPPEPIAKPAGDAAGASLTH